MHQQFYTKIAQYYDQESIYETNKQHVSHLPPERILFPRVNLHHIFIIMCQLILLLRES